MITLEQLNAAANKAEQVKDWGLMGTLDTLKNHYEKWNSNKFVASLVEQLITKGSLSPKQNDWLTVNICEFEGDIQEAKRLRAQLSYGR